MLITGGVGFNDSHFMRSFMWAWAGKLRELLRFDEQVTNYEKVAIVLNRFYERTPGG